MLPQTGKKSKQLSKNLGSSLFQFSSGAGFVVHVTLLSFDPHLNGAMHNRVKVCEQIQRCPELFSKLRSRGNGIWKKSPNESDRSAAGNAGQPIRCEQVYRVSRLPVTRCNLVEFRIDTSEIPNSDLLWFQACALQAHNQLSKFG